MFVLLLPLPDDHDGVVGVWVRCGHGLLLCWWDVWDLILCHGIGVFHLHVSLCAGHWGCYARSNDLQYGGMSMAETAETAA